MPDLIFPKGFLWGAATSSHQIEGDNHNDWTVWEAAGRVPVRSGLATDSWNRYKQDFDVIEQMHLNSYRFSIEWSRVEPAPGEYDSKALKRYKQMVVELRKRGITPIVTLHHFTSPIWISDEGGWTNGKTVHQFLAYVDKVVQALGPEVTMWCTINEPSIVSALAYLETIFPPGKFNPLGYLRMRSNLAKAHKHAYKRIHDYYATHDLPRPMVSFAHNMTYVSPRAGGLDRLAARIYDGLVNGYFLRKARGSMDYIALNYYFYRRVFFSRKATMFLGEAEDEGLPVSDLGWRIFPEGLYHLCKRLMQYNLPIIIAENGVADGRDKVRPAALVQSLAQIHRAMHEGAPVIGYMHWSLIDNFEWQHGYLGQFGLASVDLLTQKRTLRKSGKLYGQIAKTGKITTEQLREYR